MTPVSKILVVEDDLTLNAWLCFAQDGAGYLFVMTCTSDKTWQMLKSEQLAMRAHLCYDFGNTIF